MRRKLLLFLFAIAFSSFTANTMAQTASATWPLTATTTLAVTNVGNVTGTVETLNILQTGTYAGYDANGVATMQRLRINTIYGSGATAGWPALQTTELSDVWAQFAASPNAGNQFHVASVSLTIAGSSSATMMANVYISTDPTFATATRTQIYTTPGTGLPVPTVAPTTAVPVIISLTGIDILVADGQTFYVRVYPWNNNTSGITTGKYLSIQNVVISGTSNPNTPVTTAATSIHSTDFTANWNSSATATGYYLDVATDASFNNLVSGYSNKNVGNVTSATVSGLTSATDYYYQVRAYNTGGTSASSTPAISVTTATGPSTDATLSGITYGGVSVTCFSPTTTTYSVVLPYGTSTIPTVAGTITQQNANTVITQASSVTGSASIVVTAQDLTTTKTYTINFSVAAPATDATLSTLKVGGVSVTGFDPTTLTYNVTLPVGTTLTPAITATMNESHATVVINQPTSVNGSATVVVTAQDGVTKTTYTINLSALSTSNDATLSSLKINNAAVSGFAAGTLTYNITSYTAGTAVSTLPITYTVNESHATAVLTAPTAIPGVGTILVIAQDGITKLTYTINFKVTDATLSDLKVGGTTLSTFSPTSLTDTISWPNDGTIPVITYTTTESHASALVTIQPGVFGNATVVVTAQDGTTTKTYTITIRSTDATLKDLQVNGTTIAGFSPTTLAYTINYAYYNVLNGSVALPVVTAVKNDTYATLTAPTAITAFPSTSTIVVAAQNGTKASYTVYFGMTTAVTDITEQQLKISSKAGSVDIESSNNIVSIQVTNLQGKKVFGKNINSSNASVSTESWTNGIYIFSLVTEKGVITRKIGIFQ